MVIKRKKLVFISVFTIGFIITGTIWGKSVQAAKLEQSFKEAMTQGKYTEALNTYNSAAKDTIVNKLFKFTENTVPVISSELEKLKSQYIDGSIGFDVFKEQMGQLVQFNVISEELSNSTLQELQLLENSRQALAASRGFLNNKEFDKALESLNSVIKEDEKSFAASEILKEDILKAYKEDFQYKIEDLIKSNKLTEAEALMDKGIDVLESSYIEDKTREIKGLMAKKEAEERSKTANSAAKRKQAEKEAVLLTGYVASPEEEQLVKDYTSGTRFLVQVDISTQKTKIYLGQKGDWKLIKSFICSTGTPGKDTPKGNFTITRRGNWFFSNKYGQGGKYWVQFYGNYLFHSLPMDQKQNIVDYTLGTPASHGCVRLKVDEAKWLYDNIPSGTKLIVK